MGISKSIWMAQSELDQINEDINLSDDEYFDKHLIERTTEETQRLHRLKADNEAELESLNNLGKAVGLVKEGN
jgi:hypothetical protein